MTKYHYAPATFEIHTTLHAAGAEAVLYDSETESGLRVLIDLTKHRSDGAITIMLNEQEIDGLARLIRIMQNARVQTEVSA